MKTGVLECLLGLGLLYSLSGISDGQFFFGRIRGASLVKAATQAKQQEKQNESRIEAALRDVQEERVAPSLPPRFQPRPAVATGPGSTSRASTPRSAPSSASSYRSGPEPRPSPPVEESTGTASRGSSAGGSMEASAGRSRGLPPSFSSRRIRPLAARPVPQSILPSQEASVDAEATSRVLRPSNSFVPQGNARVFDPSDDPLRTRDKEPKLQNILESDTFLEDATKPLTQDFLPSCPDPKFSYIIPSPSQCDLYYLCEYGNPSKKVCEDGMVFSIEEVRCVEAHKADCQDRPLLQTPKGTGACERKNGIFYTNDTCTDFVTCRDDKPLFENCAVGLVFDPSQRICAWADEALRPGCMPEDMLGFECPNPKLSAEDALNSRVHLRFGDHDRFPDPKDCRFFFMCLRTGQPRRAGCSSGKVFDPATGICKPAADVAECADYYGSTAVASPPASGIHSSRIRDIEDDLEKQFSSQRRQKLRLRLKRWIMEEAEPEPY